MATNNAINLTAAGLAKYDGAGAFSGVTVTQRNLLIGAASNGITSVAPSATSGVPVISQGASADPTFGTAVVAGGGTGNATQAAYSLVAGGTTTTGAFQAVGPASTGQVLASGGASALPAFTATPSVTSITLGGTTALNQYREGTFTPTIFGTSVPGTTTYSAQSGSYTRIGRLVFFTLNVVWTNATGTGVIQIGGLPFNFGSGFNEMVSYGTGILVATATGLRVYGQSGNQQIAIYGYIASTGASVNSSLAANTNTYIDCTGCYFTGDA